jgi:hypothetical protein
MTTYQKSVLLVLTGAVIVLALYLDVDLAAVGRALLWVKEAVGQ